MASYQLASENGTLREVQGLTQAMAVSTVVPPCVLAARCSWLLLLPLVCDVVLKRLSMCNCRLWSVL